MGHRVSIVGTTGYTGQELLDCLLKHPQVRVTGIYSTIEEPKLFSDVVAKFKNRTNLILKKIDINEIIDISDIVFLALPHTTAMDIVPGLLKAGKIVIDLSADYRIKDVLVYEKVYGKEHKDKNNIIEAVYGLPEIYKQKIKSAKLIANPGCYPTAAILALAPVLALDSVDFNSIIIDAKSGTSGAGKKAAADLLFTEVDEDFKAYKVNVHQHMPEINQELSKLANDKVDITFVPHLLPLQRGILETIYLKTKNPGSFDTQALIDLYKKFYKDEPFVRIREKGDFPKLKDVVGTNFCDIGIRVDGEKIIIVCVIDNLLKGASGQAIQNMNIILNYPQHLGLM